MVLPVDVEVQPRGGPWINFANFMPRLLLRFSSRIPVGEWKTDIRIDSRAQISEAQTASDSI